MKPPKTPAPSKPFWETKTLEEMNPREWESLCDGCGRCCLVKLEDEDTGKILYTDIACRLFESGPCRCSDYKNRRSRVKDCVKITPQGARTLPWLPKTCAYKLLAEGRPLMWWHPLVSGTPDTVHEAGVSVRGKVSASEEDVTGVQVLDFIVSWPGKVPRAARGKKRRVANSE